MPTSSINSISSIDSFEDRNLFCLFSWDCTYRRFRFLFCFFGWQERNHAWSWTSNFAMQCILRCCPYPVFMWLDALHCFHANKVIILCFSIWLRGQIPCLNSIIDQWVSVWIVRISAFSFSQQRESNSTLIKDSEHFSCSVKRYDNWKWVFIRVQTWLFLCIPYKSLEREDLIYDVSEQNQDHYRLTLAISCMFLVNLS